MTLYELIKKYHEGGDKEMWGAIKKMSKYAEKMKEYDEDEYWELLKDVYSKLCGPHFNEEFGKWQIEQMYFVDKQGVKHKSPNWTPEQYSNAFGVYRNRLKDTSYTCWDFAVTIEMQYTDYHCMLTTWMPDATEDDIKEKAIDMAVVYLNDDDDKEGGKIWRRFND